MAPKNRIDTVFEKCREEHRAALILYITSGFPDQETTRALLPVLAENGCDIIELGIPFSDPIADGPVIQRASTIALNAGMTLPKTLALLKDFRQDYKTPVILFGALNPFLIRGLEVSASLAREAGAEGILAADLPAEESEEFRPHLHDRGLHLIVLAAPTTTETRMARVASASSGFLYAISLKGTTGGQPAPESSAEYIQRIRSHSDLPVALGFGISEPSHVRSAVKSGADGVIIGSALIKLIEAAKNEGRDVKKAVAEYLQSLTPELKRV